MTDLTSLSREDLAGTLEDCAESGDSNRETSQRMQEAARRLRATCRWSTPPEGVSTHSTQCGHYIIKAYKWTHCPYCAGALVEAREETPDEG